ncbi:MAG: transpeptidase [Deltaproteobacteria bacterium]|nr:MAG: transpeptidase [Deltaproteobacteria bacterium]
MLSLSVGSPVLIRTFKKESQLELWVKKDHSEQYFLFRSYPICYYSGDLGPKLQQGDKMTPEGFYAVTRQRLQPNSRFHLALNIGYPNRYDRYHGRTGDLLMIHGACDAIGCFAMTNEQIEEIYYLVEQALLNGQAAVPVHAFPFQLNATNMTLHEGHRWFDFWQQLKQGYDYFNQNHTPPTIDVVDGRYVISRL